VASKSKAVTSTDGDLADIVNSIESTSKASSTDNPLAAYQAERIRVNAARPRRH
jgi:hypothetical protein